MKTERRSVVEEIDGEDVVVLHDVPLLQAQETVTDICNQGGEAFLVEVAYADKLLKQREEKTRASLALPKNFEQWLIDTWQRALESDSAVGWRECYLKLDGVYWGFFYAGVVGDHLTEVTLLAMLAHGYMTEGKA